MNEQKLNYAVFMTYGTHYDQISLWVEDISIAKKVLADRILRTKGTYAILCKIVENV